MTEARLAGRAAWVTGAASGIGAACAMALAREGARVACADLRADGAEAVAKEITRAGGEAFGLKLDVADPAGNARAVEAVQQRFGPLRIAHLNAGIATSSSILDTTLEEWDRGHAVNLRGVFLGLQAAARAMVAGGQGGSIVVTASTAGLRGAYNAPVYCTTKHGVIGLVRCAASDLGARGIRVNAICPGIIDTPLLGPAHANPEVLAKAFAHYSPLRRVGRPEEVARLVVFLASDEASFMTGGAYPVDGGQDATVPAPSEDAMGGSLQQLLARDPHTS